MAIRFGSSNSQGRYFEIEYKGFGGGLDVQEPETEIPDDCTPSANNFQVRNKELRSRPAFLKQFAGMDNINPPLGVFSFGDVNSVTHTVGWSTRGLWQLAPQGLPPGALTPWFQIGGPSLLAGIPVAYQAFANILYYANGGTFLASWDGIASVPTASNAGVAGSTSIAAISVADAPTVVPGSTGPLSFGGLFLAELNNQLLLANISLLDNGTGTIYSFPNRLWWSANGIPTQWDFAVNTSAGENDFLDVPDALTGVVTMGINGYLFRTNGITFFAPTGNAVAPFQFDHLWASNHGIGNVYSWSIHSYGSIACFVSVEQIYQMGVSSFEPIGGKTRDAIMADLALASAEPTGAIVPTERLGYVYLTYRISIPLTTFTRHYWYSIEDKNWMQFDTPGLIQTGRPEEVWTGILASLPIGAQPPGSGVSGGGGSRGGGGGGQGGAGCFSGNVTVKTDKGMVRMDALPTKDWFKVVNETGTHDAILIVHENYSGRMIDMGDGQLATTEHLFKHGEDWLIAENHFEGNPVAEVSGVTVYDIHVLTADQGDMHYILGNAEVAHNKLKVGGS